MSLEIQHNMSSLHSEYTDKVLTNLVYQFAFDYEDGSGNQDAVLEAIHKHFESRVQQLVKKLGEKYCRGALKENMCH